MGLSAGGVETANLTTVRKNHKITATETYESVKLGIDAHANWYYVARQPDGATPQPVQKMDLEGLPHFVARQKRLAREVHTCYEAGICFWRVAPVTAMYRLSGDVEDQSSTAVAGRLDT